MVAMGRRKSKGVLRVVDIHRVAVGERRFRASGVEHSTGKRDMPNTMCSYF
jgi:hypothetical protein